MGLFWYLVLNLCPFLNSWDTGGTHRQKSRGNRESPEESPFEAYWDHCCTVFHRCREVGLDQLLDHPSYLSAGPDGFQHSQQPSVGN